MGAIMGAMPWANSTQRGFSGSTEPWPGSTVPPLRTMSARCVYAAVITGSPRNRAIEAMHAGDRGSRNTALVGVCR